MKLVAMIESNKIVKKGSIPNLPTHHIPSKTITSTGTESKEGSKSIGENEKQSKEEMDNNSRWKYKESKQISKSVSTS